MEQRSLRRGMRRALVEKIEIASHAPATAQAARTALRSLDLTSLNDDDTSEKISAVVAKADQKELGHVAALCVYPRFLSQIFNAAVEQGINRATVINFPSGAGMPARTADKIRSAIADGANEIDVVFDYKSFLEGDVNTAAELLWRSRKACGPDVKLKVILESAAFTTYDQLYEASYLALKCGADFLKTSTGKSEKGGASLEAAAVMLQAIVDTESHAGVKISGGVSSVQDCAQYISLAKQMLGKDAITPDRFRFGASGVLNDILGYLGKAAPKQQPGATY